MVSRKESYEETKFHTFLLTKIIKTSLWVKEVQINESVNFQ